MYSIVKAQKNLHNDIRALLGLMRVFAVEWAKRGGTAAVLCPWARHFTPRKYWLITQEAVAPSRYDWKIVDWDVKPQQKQTKRGGRDEGWCYDEWLWLDRWVRLWCGSGLGGVGCVWCWDSVGRAVDVPTRRYSTYPHQIPIQHKVFPTYPRPHRSSRPTLTT